MKVKKRDLRLVTAILISIIAVIVVAWAVINPSPGGANTSGKTQIIFGWDTNKFRSQYPNADFTPWWELATKQGITFYGIDAFLGPLKTGSGLDFTQCDTRIPTYLKLLPVGMNPIIPVSSYNEERFDATYKYFDAKGWLDQRTWLVFDTMVADEPRYNNRVAANNQKYLAFRAKYPKAEWIVTDTALPIAVGGTAVVMGDIIIPQAHHEVIERTKYGSAQQALAYAGGEKGIYIGGYFPEYTHDPNPSSTMVPGYYANVMKKYFGLDPAPFVPTALDHPEEILSYTHIVGAKYWLFWAGYMWLIPDPNNPGNPKLRPELLALISGRSSE